MRIVTIHPNSPKSTNIMSTFLNMNGRLTRTLSVQEPTTMLSHTRRHNKRHDVSLHHPPLFWRRESLPRFAWFVATTTAWTSPQHRATFVAVAQLGFHHRQQEQTEAPVRHLQPADIWKLSVVEFAPEVCRSYWEMESVFATRSLCVWYHSGCLMLTGSLVLCKESQFIIFFYSMT